MSNDESTWQPAHPAGRRQRNAPADVASGALVTHQVVIGTSEPALADLARQPDDEGHQEGALAEALSGLRFVNESPGSLRDQIEYAREGAYTHRADGPWRTANIWFARLVAVPGLTICYFLAWALFTRLSRALTAWPVLLLVMWLLNSLPLTRWLVPDWADFTTWLPGPDPSLVPGEGE